MGRPRKQKKAAAAAAKAKPPRAAYFGSFGTQAAIYGRRRLEARVADLRHGRARNPG
jgi:hypothetical protein